MGPKIHQDVAIICAEGQANEEFTFKYLSESAEAWLTRIDAGSSDGEGSWTLYKTTYLLWFLNGGMTHKTWWERGRIFKTVDAC